MGPCLPRIWVKKPQRLLDRRALGRARKARSDGAASLQFLARPRQLPTSALVRLPGAKRTVRRGGSRRVQLNQAHQAPPVDVPPPQPPAVQRWYSKFKILLFVVFAFEIGFFL